MYWNTVTLTLQQLLRTIMKSPLFDQFCLVGGTSLSLQMGHRFSVDIDLFTDVEYGSIDFDSIITRTIFMRCKRFPESHKYLQIEIN